MLEPIDALRSLGRYVSSCLGPEWEVRWTDEHGEYARPFALYGEANDLLSDVDPYVGVTFTQAYTIQLYPARAQDAELAHGEATKLLQLVVRMFDVGVGDAGPRLVPLLDFDGLALNATASRAAWLAAPARNYMRLESVSFRRLPDPEDDLTVAVSGSIRGIWTRALVPEPPEQTVARVVQGWHPVR